MTKKKFTGSIFGMTLIELVVVFSILTVVMSMAFSAFSINETYRDLVFVKIQLYRQNKKAHDAINQELTAAQQARVWITDNATPGGPDMIRFQVPLIALANASFDVPWGATFNGAPTAAGDFIRYRLLGTNLTREVLNSAQVLVGGTQEVKASGIANLQFTNPSAGYINISTTASRMSVPPQRQYNATLNSSVFLQN